MCTREMPGGKCRAPYPMPYPALRESCFSTAKGKHQGAFEAEWNRGFAASAPTEGVGAFLFAWKGDHYEGYDEGPGSFG